MLAFHKNNRPTTTTACTDDSEYCDHLKKNLKEIEPVIERGKFAEDHRIFLNH